MSFFAYGGYLVGPTLFAAALLYPHDGWRQGRQCMGISGSGLFGQALTVPHARLFFLTTDIANQETVMG